MSVSNIVICAVHSLVVSRVWLVRCDSV